MKPDAEIQDITRWLQSVARKALLGTAVLLVAFGGLMALSAAPASAEGPTTINTADAKSICQGFLASKQDVGDQFWKLPGHAKSMSDECREFQTSGVASPAIQETITNLCQAGTSSFGFTPPTQDEIPGVDPPLKVALPNVNGNTPCQSLCSDKTFGSACGQLTINDNAPVTQNSRDQRAAAVPVASSSNTSSGEPAPLDVSDVKALSDGLAFYALITCVVGILVSASLWAMGSHGQNVGTELTGKRGVIVCCTAAFFIGAVPTWINYLDNAATSGGPDGFNRDAIVQRNIPVTGQ